MELKKCQFLVVLIVDISFGLHELETMILNGTDKSSDYSQPSHKITILNTHFHSCKFLNKPHHLFVQSVVLNHMTQLDSVVHFMVPV